MNELIEQSKSIILEKCGGVAPKLAITLGSGLGDLADELTDAIVIPYTALPGFPKPSVAGHSGEMHIGRLNGCPVICLKGRVHLYEGFDKIPHMKVMIRTLKALGVDTLALTNAAGSLNPAYPPGTPVMIADHINLTGTNVLAGPNEDDWGPRFPGMDRAWDPDLQAVMRDAAGDAGIELGTGVYLAVLGPTFETPAEIRMMKTLGADLVGMSTVSENIIANHCGLRVVGCSAVTNLASGMSDVDLSHDQTLEGAKLAGQRMRALFKAFTRRFHDETGLRRAS